eukprot:CAMPEP_0194276492 /NCGR_PEP_ID=MMETSP0169-20130528/9079_1 /TAXON_ID=218684 /ORGANISM="Corethron pennatum, Strain L29A3" /LENGTH=158 /DNA_ID=CAMNT_0039020227 /DNA_START=373 /DNA_END=847 /DNA_ORIENTATION=-
MENYPFTLFEEGMILTPAGGRAGICHPTTYQGEMPGTEIIRNFLTDRSKTEMQRLAPDDVSGTSIIVVPDLYPNDFQSFLSYLSEQVEEKIMDPHDFHGMLQIAPFHPEFMFGGFPSENGNSVENCTNRSPYPMFHILKEIEVDRAVQRLDGDAGKVW